MNKITRTKTLSELALKFQITEWEILRLTKKHLIPIHTIVSEDWPENGVTLTAGFFANSDTQYLPIAKVQLDEILSSKKQSFDVEVSVQPDEGCETWVEKITYPIGKIYFNQLAISTLIEVFGQKRKRTKPQVKTKHWGRKRQLLVKEMKEISKKYPKIAFKSWNDFNKTQMAKHLIQDFYGGDVNLNLRSMVERINAALENEVLGK